MHPEVAQAKLPELSKIYADYRPTSDKVLPVYVLNHGSGVTTLGFEYCEDMTVALANWLGREDLIPPADVKGTEMGYRYYKAATVAAGKFCKENNVRCDVNLHPQLRGLESCHVEVVDEYGDKRIFWVGVSSGWMITHLACEKRNAKFADAISPRERFLSVRKLASLH